ncbi:MAG: 6-phosphogluconolactonase [Gammaproteobacteria bacterium]
MKIHPDDVNVLADQITLARKAAKRTFELATQAIHHNGSFHIALSGGSTPRLLFEELTSNPEKYPIDWQHVHIYFGDERSVHPSHQDSNYRMAHETLISKIQLPNHHAHRIEAELPPDQAAQKYQHVLEKQLPKSKEGIPLFDLVLLGLGPDGHIASLFPDTTIIQERAQIVSAVYVEKLQTWRISITYPTIDQARHIMILVSGSNKSQIIRELFTDNNNRPIYPVERLNPHGTLEWFLDKAAAQTLDNNNE